MYAPPPMDKKFKSRIKKFILSGRRYAYPSIPDPVEEERLLQQQEYQRKQRKEKEGHFKKEHKSNRPPLQNMNFEKNLERTWKWLSETFPTLFGPASPVKPLDKHILRDIKDHHKKYQIKNHYPQDLVIKAALYRYMEKPEYLLCLQRGALRYNSQGNSTEKVTEAEHEEALRLLKCIK